jgi:hypothetical protein
MRADSGSRAASVSRRRLLAGAAGAGAAVAVAGIAGTESTGAVAAAPATSIAGAGGPVVVHLRDAATGAMDVFCGTERIEIRDRALAEGIARVAANADQINRRL